MLMRLVGQTRTEKELNGIVEKYFEEESDKNEQDNEKDNKGKETNTNKDKGKEEEKEKTKNEGVSADSVKTQSKVVGLKKENGTTGITKGISKLGVKNTLGKSTVVTNSNEEGKEIKKRKKINFESFVNILQQSYTEPISLNKLIRSFEIFDNEKKGYITAQQLKDILTTCEEKLTDEEMKFFLKSVDLNDNNMIDYVHLSRQLKSRQY